MSLLDDVSIVVTPNGYKAGTLYGVLPVPTEGSELITNGGFTADAVWVKSPSGVTIDGSGFAYFTSGQDTYVFQSIMTIEKQYSITLDYNITSITSGYFGSNFGSGNAILSMAGLSGSGTLSGIITATSDLLIIRSSTFDGTITNVSVKEYTASDMDVTRATAGTRVDENGLVNYAEVLGSENIDLTTGDTLDASSWSSVTTSSVTYLAGGSNPSYYNTGLIVTSGLTYKLTFTISSYTGTGSIGFSTTAGVSSDARLTTDDSYTEYFVATSSVELRLFGLTTNAGVFSNVSVKEVTRNNVPRIDYTGGGCPHILAEPQRTNLLTYSEDFSQSSWSKTSGGTGSVPVITSNNVISPDGTQNASRIVFDAGSGTSNSDKSEISSSVTASDNTNATASIYLKGLNGGEQLVFRGVASSTYTLITLTTEWQRFSTTEDSGTSNDFIQFGIRQSVSGHGVINANPTIFAWGAQIEEGSYATSYIPTSGSTVTRNQDLFTRDGISSLINSIAGVFFIEMATFLDEGTTADKWIALSDGTANNSVRIAYSGGANTIRAYLNVGGSAQADMTYAVTDVTQFSKIAFSYAANNFNLWVDGVKRVTDTSGSVFSANTLNRLGLDNGGGGSFPGKIKQLQVYKTALTDTQLAALTS